MERTIRKKHITPYQISIWGFAIVITVGTLLLMLPISAKSGQVTPFSEALFTATSAVCVTGLVIHDTAMYWTTFGHFVILMLIQIGGLGVVTVAGSIAMLSGRRIGLMQRSTMQEAIAAPQVGGIVRLTRFVLVTAFAIEFLGAAALSPVFCREFGFFKGLWYSVFHAVSAFCNAGFDLMGAGGEYSSLTAYAGHPVVNITIMALIFTGGLGFLTWEDVRTNKLHWKRYRMQTKVIISASAVLILFPAAYFFFCEFQEEPMDRRVLLSLFQSVTPRTAGFNTADLTEMSEAGQSIITGLMLVGGSPGSTAGGMKTTTAVVLLASAISVFRRRENPCLFGRRVSTETVRNGASILLLYLLLPVAGAVCISAVEDLPMMSCLFETASAIGTVGLTLGITPSLGLCARIILIALMFIGRVGGLTMIFATFSGVKPEVSKLPQGQITVG